jgi:cardiolipin synthase A/B
MASGAPPSHTLAVEPTDGRGPVLAAIETAQRTLDLGIYELGDPAIVAALTDACRRSVAVRVLYNWYSFDTGTQQNEIAPVVEQLGRAGASCRRAPRSFEVTHEKVVVTDGTSALVLTFNLAPEYFVSTRDFGVRTTVASEVGEIASVFEADWSSQPVEPSVPTLLWSPTNSRVRLLALIEAAERTLEVYNEELSDPGVLGALVAAAGRGVSVRVIAAVLASGTAPNANAPGITYLTSHGVATACKAFPIPTASGAVPIYIHAKVVVADVGTPNARAFVGSQNFSCVSLDDNRECGILLDEAAILSRLEATFDDDWAQPSVVVTPEATPLIPCPPDAPTRARARAARREPA